MIDTDDFLADLEHHLQEAAERRDARRRGRSAAFGPRRRRRHGGLALRRLAPRRPRVRGAAGLAVLGVAALALVIAIGRGAPSPPDDKPIATPSPHVDVRGRRIASRAASDTYRLRVCRRAADAVPPFVDTPLSPQIAKVLPGLASGPGAKLRLEPMTARGVLRSSARRVSLGPGLGLTVYVLDGLPIGGLADPAGCLGARIARAEALSAAEPAAVQQSAQRQVRAFRDTAPELQTLMLQLRRSGAGLPTWPARSLHTGVVLSSSAGKGRGAYVGIADPRAAHVVVHAPKPFTVPVKQGFYGFVLNGPTGRVLLDETAADGTVVATRRIR